MKFVVAFLALLPVHKEDTASERLEHHQAAIAAAVQVQSTRSPVSPRQWAALLITIGHHESAFSIRISDGNCKPHECDRGRARGMWQLHRNTFNYDQWEKQGGDVALQAELASNQLKRAYWTCPNDFPRGAINAYAGKRCTADWPGLRVRLATYARLRP